MKTFKPVKFLAATALILSILQGALAAPPQVSTERGKGLATATASKRWDGPFGVQMSLTRAQIESTGVKLVSVDAAVGYAAYSAPYPHKSFRIYNYIISKRAGLCGIAAFTPKIESNIAGNQIKFEFSLLEDSLIAKYGKPKQHHFFKKTSKSNDPTYWMEALNNDELVHTSIWDDSITNPLPHSLKQIVLETQPNGSSAGVIRLIYSFKNAGYCTAETLKDKDSPL